MSTLATITLTTLCVALAVLARMTIKIVPQQHTWLVERLGRYDRTLEAGFHLLVPFVDRIGHRHSLKEIAVDIPEQICITRDNVQVGVDGVLYLQIFDSERASYGIEDYGFAISQLAQTTLRSEIGKLDLDRTFEERNAINASVVREVDVASDAWGVRVLRYEISDINPPDGIVRAMEKQMRAERERRAVILESEGVRDAERNRAEGAKARIIMESEAQRQRRINEAEGEALAIEEIARATAAGLDAVAASLEADGGDAAMRLRLAEQYMREFGRLAEASNSLIVPADVGDVASMIAIATRAANAPTKASADARR